MLAAPGQWRTTPGSSNLDPNSCSNCVVNAVAMHQGMTLSQQNVAIQQSIVLQHGAPWLPRFSEILSRGHRQLGTTRFTYLKSAQVLLPPRRTFDCIIADALPNFARNQIHQPEPLTFQFTMQPAHFRPLGPPVNSACLLHPPFIDVHVRPHACRPLNV
jgi:hypothetical protein